jgi:hypothetical protein
MRPVKLIGAGCATFASGEDCDSQGRDLMFGSGPYFNGPAVLGVVPNVVKQSK